MSESSKRKNSKGSLLCTNWILKVAYCVQNWRQCQYKTQLSDEDVQTMKDNSFDRYQRWVKRNLRGRTQQVLTWCFFPIIYVEVTLGLLCASPSCVCVILVKIEDIVRITTLITAARIWDNHHRKKGTVSKSGCASFELLRRVFSHSQTATIQVLHKEICVNLYNQR